MEKIVYILAVVALFFAVIAATLIRRRSAIRKNRVCSQCGGQMQLKKCRREIDLRQEKVSIGGTRMVGGSATEYYSVLRCAACGHEIEL